MGSQVPLHPKGVQVQGASAPRWTDPGVAGPPCLYAGNEERDLGERRLEDEREANSRRLMGLDPRCPLRSLPAYSPTPL